MSWTKVEEGELTPAEQIEASQKNNSEAMSDLTYTVSQGQAFRAKVTASSGVDIPDGKVTITIPKKPKKKDVDMVNHPPHYTSHPSGVECIQITEHMGFNLGNALKYIWRADLKGSAVEDLEKAVFYINRELVKRRAK